MESLVDDPDNIPVGMDSVGDGQPPPPPQPHPSDPRTSDPRPTIPGGQPTTPPPSDTPMARDDPMDVDVEMERLVDEPDNMSVGTDSIGFLQRAMEAGGHCSMLTIYFAWPYSHSKVSQ